MEPVFDSDQYHKNYFTCQVVYGYLWWKAISILLNYQECCHSMKQEAGCSKFMQSIESIPDIAFSGIFLEALVASLPGFNIGRI